MTSIHVPARHVPAPSSISQQARDALAVDLGGAGSEGYPPLGDTDGWRKRVGEMDAVVGPMLAGAAESVAATVEARTVAGIRVDVVTPDRVDDDRVVLEIHGGALILLGGALCTAMTRLAVGRVPLMTWGPDYRMPPDHPYPAALDDCLATYRALLDERPPDRIVVSGSSAGGNLAAALVLRAGDEGLPLPAAVVLGTPEVDLTESGDSFVTNLGVDSRLRPLMPVNVLYADGHDLAHPYLSPVFGDLRRFPPTILTTGTRDLFLSNTVRMHRALRRVGVAAELHVLEAAPHGGFFGLAPEDDEITDEIRRFIDRYAPPVR